MKNSCMLLARIAVIFTSLTLTGRAATVADFGHRLMGVNGVLASGQRPLIVILADFANTGTFAHSANDYDQQIFDLNSKSVNGFIRENSNGRFQFSRVGVIGPVTFTAEERTQAMTNDIMAYGHAIVATARLPFDFRALDANRDGTITQDELVIVIVSNASDNDSGAVRWANPTGAQRSFQLPNSSISFQTAACAVTHRVSFATLCHEVSHLLGTIDVYGMWGQECLSGGLTLMSCTIRSPDDPDIFHLDPWHKMRLGWCEPKVRSLRAYGSETIAAAQAQQADAPVILYDPAVGAAEFFIIEYRTQTSPYGSRYDTNVSGNGLVIWRIKQDNQTNLVLVPSFDAGPLPAQTGWKWCSKCQGLHYVFYIPWEIVGPCPAGGSHSTAPSEAYQVVLNNASAPGEHGWRMCSKCLGLFSGMSEPFSRCPAGGRHDGSSSGDYSLGVNDPEGPGQKGWRWCDKCQGIFVGGGGFGGICPVGGAHEGFTSGNYSMLIEGVNYVMWAEGPAQFKRGSDKVWQTGVTPYLHWLDGAMTCTKIRVLPFTIGDGSITVEWLTEECTWVDFNYFGSLESGTFDFPFNTLAEGVNAVSWGGTLKIKSGATPETAHITKAMTIQAYGGPVTIGR